MDKALQDAVAVANDYGLTDRELAQVVEAATAARRAVDARPGLVPMTHPLLPLAPQRVDPEAVAVYESSGWVVAADTSPDAAPEIKPEVKATTKSKKDEEN